MKEDETAKWIAELEQRLATLLETIEKMPPSLPKALELHEKWLRKEEGGIRLDLSGANLSGAIMRNVDLTGADLTGATGVGPVAGRERTRGDPRHRSRD